VTGVQTCALPISHEPRDLDTRGAVEPLAAASDAACDPVDRVDFRHRFVERRAGAEPAGARQLRPRRRDVRRRANGLYNSLDFTCLNIAK
jgi:hypothetical protein